MYYPKVYKVRWQILSHPRVIINGAPTTGDDELKNNQIENVHMAERDYYKSLQDAVKRRKAGQKISYSRNKQSFYVFTPKRRRRL